MMGRSHALIGGVGWLAVAPPIANAMGAPLGGTELAAGAVVCAGAALLPDIDHPSATIANSLGPITKLIATGMAVISGGHRKGTHSLLFCLLAGLLTAAAAALPAYGRHFAIGIGYFMVALALRAVGPAKTKGGWIGLAVGLQAAVLAYLAYLYVPDFSWLPYAVGGGSVLHLVGDIVTPQGVPLFWPKATRYSIPVIARTGNMVETGVATSCLFLLCFLVYRSFVAPVF